jgi:hypothetical protein
LSTDEALQSGRTSIVDLSQNVLQALRKDEEFVLFRGKHPNHSDSPPVLVLAPASMQPALETLKKIEKLSRVRPIDQCQMGHVTQNVFSADARTRDRF